MKALLVISLLLVISAAQLLRAEAVKELNQRDRSREVIRMTVTPADEPAPAFEHRLSLRPHELVRGNSVAHYMRAYPESGIDKRWRKLWDDHGLDEVSEWHSDMPLNQLPIDIIKRDGASLREQINNYIVPGSKCRDTDWGVAFEDIKGPEIISFLLPEIQGMRSTSRAISLETRLAIAEHRYDDAIELMRVNYRLGRDVGTQPILVSGLVGIAIHGITNNNMIDFLAAKDSPNLYWALTEMPRPQVSLRDAMRLELAIGPRMFPMLDHPERQVHTYDEWNVIWQRDCGTLFSPNVAGLVNSMGASQPSARGMISMGLALSGYSHAKGRLVAWGYKSDEVERMAVGQVMAIYQAGVYQRLADEMEKAFYVDYADSRELERKASELIRNAGPLSSSPDRELLPVASLLLPAVSAARSAGVRIERDLDALRVIEALRMHAARNEGDWPKALEEITCVPVPKNPATGKPFLYSLEGDTAVLLLPHSDGLRYERQYELTTAK